MTHVRGKITKGKKRESEQTATEHSRKKGNSPEDHTNG
jgi:hypothetical protein